MKCVLHIGTEKTGTTTLQDWFYLNRKEFSRNGIYLSENLGKTNNRLFPAYFQNGLDDWAAKNGIIEQKQKQEFFTGFEKKIRNEIKQAKKKHNIFLISSEHLHSRIVHHDEIQRLRHFVTTNFESVTVICYFRHQFDMAISRYSTALRHHFHGTLDDFLSEVTVDNRYYNFLEIANFWSNAFGSRNCIYKIYEKNKFEGADIRKDFIKTIAPDLIFDNLKWERSKSNSALGRVQGALYASSNAYLKNTNFDTNLQHSDVLKLRKLIDGADEFKFGHFSSDKRDAFIEMFSEINNAFLEKYFPIGAKFLPSVSENVDAEVVPIAQIEKIARKSFELGLTAGEMLTDSDINMLRDIAICIEKGNELDIGVAIELMQIAKRHRPNGPIIGKKLREWL